MRNICNIKPFFYFYLYIQLRERERDREIEMSTATAYEYREITCPGTKSAATFPGDPCASFHTGIQMIGIAFVGYGPPDVMI